MKKVMLWIMTAIDFTLWNIFMSPYHGLVTVKQSYDDNKKFLEKRD